MQRRFGALIRATDLHSPTRHFDGMPSVLGGSPTPKGWPSFVVIEERPDGFFLFRFTKSLEVVGDTWHQSEADAKDQARAEYGQLLGPWKEVAVDLTDEELLSAIVDETPTP